MWGEIANSFQTGNLYMMAIIGFAFIATILILERFAMLQLVYNIEFSKFLNNLRKMVTSDDFDRAVNLCKSVSRTSLPKIALRALEAAENDPTSVRGTIEEDTIELLPRIESRIGVLPAIATLVMLVGVLGTIDQLWWAFHSIDVLDTAKKQASLATGIAASLNPTAMGLLVSMIILTSHQILKGMAIRLLEQIHHGVTVLTNLLAPAEVSYVAAPSANAASIDAVQSDADGGASSEPSEVSRSGGGERHDGANDDTTVEDIKDEEEII